MPIYEYECTKCGHRVEVQQKATARPLRKCKHLNGGKKPCGGDLKKLFFPAAIIFKGSGWHIKDYGKNGANGRASSASKSKSESASSSSSSSSASDSSTKTESKKETTAAKA